MLPASTIPHIAPSERATIAELAFKLTGSRPESEARLESCIVNILRRMNAVGAKDLKSYLIKVHESEQERGHLVSAMTIHHTSWFRESIHLDRLQKQALEFAKDIANQGQTFMVLSAGCSTGEEALSIGLVLQRLKLDHPGFDYRIEGWDVDPVSVATAKRSIYPRAAMASVPSLYHPFLWVGSEQTEGYFTLDKAIRDRCNFRQRSLLMPNEPNFQRFHAIYCRNVLIYFKDEQVRSIILSLQERIHANGMLVLGHSEAIDPKLYKLEGLGNSCYRPLNREPGPAGAGTQAKAKILRLSPQVARPTEILQPIRPDIILIGASTGGTDALERLLKDLPRPCPPVVVVQHIAHAFAKSFAERLSAISSLSIGDIRTGSLLRPHHLYMSWGDYHLALRRQGGNYILSTNQDKPVHSVRPSVDVLFDSAAQAGGHYEKILACLMTGMGKDGASGMLALRRAGAMTCTQDEKSSVVFGMPAEAVALGASQFSGSPEKVRELILKLIALPERH